MSLGDIRNLDYTVLLCSKMQETRAFYLEIMGFPLAHDSERWVSFQIGSTLLTLAGLLTLAHEWAEVYECLMPTENELVRAMHGAGITSKSRDLRRGDPGLKSAVRRGVQRPRETVIDLRSRARTLLNSPGRGARVYVGRRHAIAA